MKKILSSILVTVFICTLFIGCGSSSNDSDASGNTEEKKITWALQDEPQEMDPTLNQYARSSQVLQNLFIGLYKLDEKGESVPGIAESYTVDDTNTVYTFKINKDAKWSDGKQITANDFEYSFKRVLDPSVASPTAQSLYVIKNGQAANESKVSVDEIGVKAIDESTIEVTLEAPISWFIGLLSTTAYFPVRQDIIEANGDNWKINPETYICNGPYKIKELKQKEKYTFVKNENYLFSDNVKLDTLEIVFIDAPETTLTAYNSDEIQYTENISQEDLNGLKDSEDYNEALKIGVQYFDFNTEHEALNNPKVRQALVLALDRNQIVEKILQSPGKVLNGWVPYGIPSPADQTKDFRDAAGDMFTTDIEKAKALLADAGYPNGEGFPVIKITTTTTQLHKDEAQAFQSMWKENLGIDSEIQTFESKIYWDELTNGNFDVAADGWTGDYLDPMTNLEIFESYQNTDDNRWNNAEYDALLAENRTSTDQQKRYENFVRTEQILAEEMPIFPMYNLQSSYLCKPYVTGIHYNKIGHCLFEYADIQK